MFAFNFSHNLIFHHVGLIPLSLAPVYTATKAGVIAFTRCFKVGRLSSMFAGHDLITSTRLSCLSQQENVCTRLLGYATSYNIIQHSPTCYMRDGQTDATLSPNNVGLCCDRMLRPFDQGLECNERQFCSCFRSPLMKTLDWSVETLGRECNSTGLCIHFNKTRIASRERT